MLFLIFISSGLFLGWSLGSNDAANIFGSAVGSKMLSFKRAAWIASICVILGAVFQGKGGAETLNALGEVDALAGGFMVSLAAAATVFLMTRRGLPVSTSQAVVGAIIAWTFFAGKAFDASTLYKILYTWLASPILGALFAAILYRLLTLIIRKSRIHVIKLDAVIRVSLILAGAFGAYSLGANNIANIMGVFVSAAPDILLNFGLFTIDGVQLLFLLGGVAIAVGIFTFSEGVMHTVGNGILSLSSEAALVVVLAQALVLFLFSSIAFSNLLLSVGLPAIPLVPVSSTQVVIGAVLGIGMVKGSREIKGRAVAGIALGWILTPLTAGIMTYFGLFFLQNVFNLQVTLHPVKAAASQPFQNLPSAAVQYDFVVPGMIVMAVIAIGALSYVVFLQKQRRLKAENLLLLQQNELYTAQKTMNDLEIAAIQAEKENIRYKLEGKRKEYIDVALNLSEQREFLDNILKEIAEIRETADKNKMLKRLTELDAMIRQRMSFKSEKEDFIGNIEQIHHDFLLKLDAAFPGLTDNEKRLAALLRLNLPGKEIASIMSISPKSVEVARYRLKKRLGLHKSENLITFIHQL